MIKNIKFLSNKHKSRFLGLFNVSINKNKALLYILSSNLLYKKSEFLYDFRNNKIKKLEYYLSSSEQTFYDLFLSIYNNEKIDNTIIENSCLDEDNKEIAYIAINLNLEGK